MQGHTVSVQTFTYSKKQSLKDSTFFPFLINYLQEAKHLFITQFRNLNLENKKNQTEGGVYKSST